MEEDTKLLYQEFYLYVNDVDNLIVYESSSSNTEVSSSQSSSLSSSSSSSGGAYNDAPSVAASDGDDTFTTTALKGRFGERLVIPCRPAHPETTVELFRNIEQVEDQLDDLIPRLDGRYR